MYTHGRVKASGYSSLSGLYSKSPSLLTLGHPHLTQGRHLVAIPPPLPPCLAPFMRKKPVSTLHKHLRKNSQHFPSQANNISLHKEKGIYNIFNGEKYGFSNYLTTPGLYLHALSGAAGSGAESTNLRLCIKKASRPWGSRVVYHF